jgi:hypothetical protein
MGEAFQSMNFKNLKKNQIKPNQKSRDFYQMLAISKKKARTLGKKSIGQAMDFKVYGKSIALPMDFHS